ncbi:MFS glucose transporter mfs1, partial [Fusarium oxysporum f. sp. albedinis]
MLCDLCTNRDNLLAIGGGQEHRSVVFVKLHHDNTGRYRERR